MGRVRTSVKLLWAFAVLAACEATAATDRAAVARATSADSIVLERTACFGTCPAYRLSVSRSGRVTFRSQNPGDESRTAKDSMAPSAAAGLLADAAKAGIYSLPDSTYGDPQWCAAAPTDFPWAIVTLFDKQGARRVADYQGCFLRMGTEPGDWSVAPMLVPLRMYEAAIDSVTRSSRWTRPAVR